MEKIVLLLSGGLDSSVLLSILKSKKMDVLPIYIDYGQRNIIEEFKAAKYISEYYDCKLAKIKVGPLFKNSLLIEKDCDHSAFLPHRNLLFLVLGAIFAYNSKSNTIAIALHAGSNYPDSSQDFIERAEKSITCSVGKEVIVYAPFIEITKYDVAYLAHLMKVPIEKTYSCYRGEIDHCGQCSACIQRMECLREIEKYVRANS